MVPGAADWLAAGAPDERQPGRGAAQDIPVEMQGRVYACRNSLQFCTIPLGLLAGGALIDGVCEPWMASLSPGSLPVLLFGTGKGAGAALLLFLLGLLGVAVCLVFGRMLRKYTFREEP